MLVEEDRVDHIDLNFGCPMPKVTRKGGGAAIPLKPRLFAAIVGSAVEAAGDVPVTVKFRLGTDAGHLTFLDTGRIADALFLPYWFWGGAITLAIAAMVWKSLQIAGRY